ncbi:glycine betaine ABC transporter substrate-binding protein [Gordonia mangrovi]|uniref:glycine betaine ABC transporter substrate-binding protein n=1 Tax=Gordonia mangrovi TaxID=2665643 RepID=UPI0021AC0A17|nr:glycine betaine ABC transporter substrate-binding protein [Gordonia mangrovi]UVF78671.1 glycine betaine ABC transporter substrate-binding protein [Gordonia mangrovi]
MAAALLFTACGGGSGEDVASRFSSCSVTAGIADASAEPVGEPNIIIGAFVGWDESTAAAHLMKNILATNGYDAQVKTLDVRAGFSATANGEIDVIPDVWLPTTHSSYIDRYGSRMDPLGCWYDNAQLTIAVNSSSPARSIADLATMGGAYDNTLVGIEPGAGETSVVINRVIPEYGLADLTFRSSSTADMLGSLQQATDDQRNIAVTLWRPHWAYTEFDIRDLEDPKGAMGGEEGIWNFATKGFGDSAPKAAQMFTNLILPDAGLAELEYLMVQRYDRADPDGAVVEWLSAHPDFADRLVAGTLGE